MRPDIQQRFENIEGQRASLQNSALALTEAQLHWSPSLAVWSVGQIIQHLVLSDETLGQAKDPTAMENEAPTFRVLPRPWRRTLILGALKRDTVLPLPSPAIEPRENVPLPQLLTRWEVARAEMRLALDNISEEERRYFHQVAGPLTAAQMLELNQTHMAYHTRQIEALQRNPVFPPKAKV